MSPFSRAAAKEADSLAIDPSPSQLSKPHGKDEEPSTALRRAPVINVCCFFLLIITAGLVMVFSINKVRAKCYNSMHETET